MKKKCVIRYDTKNRVYVYDINKNEEKQMNTNYKFSYLACVVSVIAGFCALIFLAGEYKAAYTIACAIGIAATSVSLFTLFNEIPTKSEKDAELQRIDDGNSRTAESIWRELDRINDRLSDLKDSQTCCNSKKTR